MRYKISIYNSYTGQKTIRYIVDASRVKELSMKAWEEIEQHAFEVVLTEIEHDVGLISQERYQKIMTES